MRIVFPFLIIIGLGVQLSVSSCQFNQNVKCSDNKEVDIDSLTCFYENWLIHNQKGKIHISLSDEENVEELFMEYLGVIKTGEDSILLIKNDALFGLPQSPHRNGSITIYQNEKKIGRYIGFTYMFKAWVENNELIIRFHLGNSDNESIIGPLNVISFDGGVPKDFIVKYSNTAFGEYIYLETE